MPTKKIPGLHPNLANQGQVPEICIFVSLLDSD